MEQYTGKVSWFNNAKGFGFLHRQAGDDLFVHYTAIVSEGFRALHEGDEVEFHIVQGATDRSQAANVKKIKLPNLR